MDTPRTNIIRRISRGLAVAALCLSLLCTVVLAHGGLEHVMGVVQKISQTSVTVATTDGKSREVVLDEKTTYTKNGHPVQGTDIKVGDRVVIHAAKSDDKLIARTVQAGTAK